MTCVSAPPNLPSSSFKARAKPSRACFAPTEDVLDRLFMKAILTGAAQAGAFNAVRVAAVQPKIVARSLMARSPFNSSALGGRYQVCRVIPHILYNGPPINEHVQDDLLDANQAKFVSIFVVAHDVPSENHIYTYDHAIGTRREGSIAGITEGFLNRGGLRPAKRLSMAQMCTCPSKSRHVPRSLRVPAPDTNVFHAVHFRFSPNY